MLGEPHVDHSARIEERIDPRPFLGSYRALAVRTREFNRLTQAAVRGVIELHASLADVVKDPVVQRSPERCIVQLGPVALTMAWLRATLDSAADGELLVIVWRGVVAGSGGYVPDRTTRTCTPVRSATVLWEETFSAVAADEASWLWRPADADIGGHQSAQLAERCVDRLRRAYEGEMKDRAACAHPAGVSDHRRSGS